MVRVRQPGAVGQAHAAQAFGHGVAAQLVFAVGHAGGGGGIGDAVQARDRAQGHAHGAGVYVEQIRDQFRVLRVGQRRADDAGLAVMQRAHGVIQMREAGGAGGEGGDAFFIAAQGVADLHTHAACTEGADQAVMPGDFRGDGDHPDRRQAQVGFHFFHQCGVGEVGLRAEFARIDVGPFQVYAEDPGGCRSGAARRSCRAGRARWRFHPPARSWWWPAATWCQSARGCG